MFDFFRPRPQQRPAQWTVDDEWTPVAAETDRASGPWCLAALPRKPLLTAPFVCTRKPGHRGYHVHTEGGLIYAVWLDQPPA